MCSIRGFLLLALFAVAPGAAADEHLAVRAEHHAHIRSQATAELIAATDGEGQAPEVVTATSAAELIVALDNAGARYGLVVSVAYRVAAPGMDVDSERQRLQAENDYVAEQVALAPDRLVGACSVNPLSDYAVDEVQRCARSLSMPVLKLHLANSEVDLSNEEHVRLLYRTMYTAERQGMSALVHLRHDEAFGAAEADTFIREILVRLPEMQVQIAHMAGWGGYDDATDAALGAFIDAIQRGRIERGRIHFDLAAVVFDPAAAGDNAELAARVTKANEKLAERIRELGADRVLFATDWPAWPPTRDLDLKIAQNAKLIEKALPLTGREWDRIRSNLGAMFGDLY